MVDFDNLYENLVALGSMRPGALTTPSFMPKGLSGVLAATGLIFVAYWGFESIATVGGEIQEPARNIPRACVLAVLVSGAIYMLVSLASLGAVGWEALASSSTPLVLVGRALMGTAGEIFVSCLGAVATLTSLNAALLSAARISYALARDGLLPEVLSAVHPRFRTPYRAVGLSTLIAGLFALSGIASFLAGAASFGFLTGLLMVNISMIFLRRKRRYLPREFRAPAYPLTPIVAIGACLALMAFMEPLVLAMGATIIVMPTGGGSPSGSPIAPTIKVTGNPNTSRRLMEYIDIDVSRILAGLETVEEAGARIYRRILRVASGEPTKIEKLGYGATAIYTLWTHL